jgi:predicted RNA-binding Zn-ribbon protein involved in translation (DUF1610 family)
MAFVEAREIETVFGNVYFDNEWYLCKACNTRFTLNHTTDIHQCPHCKSTDIYHI